MSAESTSLGKRKEREDETPDPHKGSTIFVSNLPYSATSTDLNTLFSDLGPVRSAFVVLDHSTGSSKGVGYVSFAIKEDAQAAFDKVNEHGEGILLDGRKLRAAWPDSSKQHHNKDAPKNESVKNQPKPPRQPPASKQPAGPKDPLAIRTIVVSGLPTSLDSKTLWKKMRKYKGAEKADWPIQKDGVEDSSTAHVLFATPAAASEAVNKLHAHVFKGSLLSVTLKKRLDGLAKPIAKAALKKLKQESTEETSASSSKSVVPAPSRASRLIVRNLPWNITEQDLRSVFLPYGPIHSIHIPLAPPKESEVKPEGDAKPRQKGYAFVWMLSKKDAEKAVEGANGTKVSAGMADALVRDKQKKKKLRREEKKIKEIEKARKEKAAKETKEGGEDEEEGDEEQSEGEVEEVASERVIAVDWALSKEKWEEAKTKMQEEEYEQASGEEDEEKVSGSGEEDSGDESDSHIGVHEGDDSDGSEDDDDDDKMDVDEPPTGRPTLPPPETGTTLFVRNVPFEATEEELRTTFRAFGPLRYARVTMDRETGRSRGTGFVCFWNKADADKAVEQSDILRAETTGGEGAAPKKNPFKLPSLLTPDPSASVAKNLVLHGRTMDVIRAVTRDEAGKLKEEGERRREKADKRNMYLLREGIILPNTPAAEGMSPAEVDKRTQSFNARRALLKSNPSLYVSRTRLSVRQLPLFVTERMLKRLAIHAVRAFETEVKAKQREGLSADELTEPVAEDEDADAAKKIAKPKGKGRNTGVQQAKIVRQQDRVDAATGKGRSRGYGFLEMTTHADALRVLRWANNNAGVIKLFETWWKEEVEDLIKHEKSKPTTDGRLERLKKLLEDDDRRKAKGSLIMEFSIENVQVVKRRAAHQQESKAETSGADVKKAKRSKSSAPPKKEAADDERPLKKRHTTDSEAKESSGSSTKGGDQLGSLIGRKRKERKSKKGKS
ncbi:RNA-binding domain-containing protein [Cristinia sonorae]|uniref:RNA-binding domain-containing protein n=1 Tax=Cristinia sonorae TaxID=1940300 RepID=A0A8K0XS32_9AGAR|nr:RNA-binding domain-containing protein [Cristinia sonorae]